MPLIGSATGWRGRDSGALAVQRNAGSTRLVDLKLRTASRDA